MKRLLALILLLLVAGCHSLAKSMGEATPQTRLDYVQKNDPPELARKAILEGRVIEGMTHNEVVAALGKYDDYNESRVAGKSRLQLVYQSRAGMAFVYLEGGSSGYMTVTSWQNVCKMPDFCVEAP